MIDARTFVKMHDCGHACSVVDGGPLPSNVASGKYAGDFMTLTVKKPHATAKVLLLTEPLRSNG